MKRKRVLIRGGGDLATGIAHRLFQAGFELMILELDQPTVIRRTVAFANAMYNGLMTVEGVTACRVNDLAEAEEAWKKHQIPVASGNLDEWCEAARPDAVVDATLAKKNRGVRRTLAPVVIGVGPGFEAGKEVDAVVESQRGHHLGRVLYRGEAAPNTGVPGIIAGVGEARLLRAPAAGCFIGKARIGEAVKAGQEVAFVGERPVVSRIDGLLRGLLADGLTVPAGFKVGDVDPRMEEDLCILISDKARAVGGGVLEAILHLQQLKTDQG